MSEDLIIPKAASKADIYEAIWPQVKALTENENDSIANVANIIAVLKEAHGFWWVGCYFIKGEELVLGPFQGPVACTRIKKGKGVCGKSWENEEVLLVKDVANFPGHIACSSATRSEIVLPVFKNGNCIGVLDVDSDKVADFDETDQYWLEKIADLIGNKYNL